MQKLKNLGILKIYYIALGISILPFLSFVLFLIDQFTFQKTEMLFWILFLVGMVPCGLIVLILSIIGLIKSLKNNHKLNIIIGCFGLLGGIINLVGGLIGLMLIYAVIGG